MATTILPSEADIRRIPLARAGEYELNEREVKTLRSRIYALNRENVPGWRWRTLREGPLLLVWRVR